MLVRRKSKQEYSPSITLLFQCCKKCSGFEDMKMFVENNRYDNDIIQKAFYFVVQKRYIEIVSHMLQNEKMLLFDHSTKEVMKETGTYSRKMFKELIDKNTACFLENQLFFDIADDNIRILFNEHQNEMK